MPLFNAKEDTLFKAFAYASAVVGVSTALVLEYRAADPFGTYRRAGDGDPRPISFAGIFETSVVSFLSTFVVLWALYFIFGLGQSFVLAAEENETSSAPHEKRT